MMVDFDIVAALIAGFVGTVVMSLMMNGAKAAGMTNMPPMPLVMGSMFSGERMTAMAIGSVLHFIVMGTVMFGLAYAGLFSVLDNDAWWIGLLIGVAHGLVVGVMAMPMMPKMHPRMGQDATIDGPSSTNTVQDGSGGLRVAAPGVLGSRWGGLTPVGLVMGHAVYGIVVALVYHRLAGS